MNYTLNQLQIFLKVVQTRSITKASEEMNLTQPAVSIQMRNLQAQFDLPLTEVMNRRLYITDFGLEVAEAAENIMSQVQAIQYKNLSHKGRLTGKLKVSVVSTGKYVMPRFLSEFLRRNEGVDLLMDVTNKSKVVESLENNEVDFALVSIIPSTMQVEKLDLLQNKLYLVGGEKLANKEAASAKEVFRDLPLIFRERGSGTRQTMENFLKKRSVSFRKKMELTSNEAVKQALLAGLGYSIMPLIGMGGELQNGLLHIVPVKGLPIKTTWSLIWLKGKRHNPVCSALLQHLRKEKDRIVRERFGWYEGY